MQRDECYYCSMKKKILLLILVVVMVTLYAIASRKPFLGDQSAQESPEVMVHSVTITDEQSFLMEMIPHHQEAVDTSQVVLDTAKSEELLQFAQKVVTVQNGEIDQMKGWLKEWYNFDFTQNPAYLPMMDELKMLEGSELEKVYIMGMIRHHQGAIEMAQIVQTLEPKTEIQKMAQDIITTQKAEIVYLQELLDTKYAQVEVKQDTEHELDIH